MLWTLTVFGPDGALIVMKSPPLTPDEPGVPVDVDVLADDRAVVVDSEGHRRRPAVGDEGVQLALLQVKRVAVAVGADHGTRRVDPEGVGRSRAEVQYVG